MLEHGCRVSLSKPPTDTRKFPSPPSEPGALLAASVCTTPFSLCLVYWGKSNQLARQFRLPLMSLRDLMSVVRPSDLVAADSILDAVTYHADPNRWSGDPLMVRSFEGGGRAFLTVHGRVDLYRWGWQLVICVCVCYFLTC